MNDLPPGFTLDAPKAASTGGALPPGFTLDAPSAAASGGVQDWEPSQQPTDPTVMEQVNRGINWLGTQGTKALTNFAGTPRMVSDVIAMLPEGVRKAVPALEIPKAVGALLPSTDQMNHKIFQDWGVPEVSLPGPVGKAVDAGTQTAISALAFPGSIARNLLPAFAGGAAQEVAGQETEGTKAEPFARAGTALVAGGLTAGTQNLLGNLAQAVRNMVPNIDETAAKIIARAIIRDKDTAPQLAARQTELGTGAPMVEAGGPNVRGAMRGAVAAPGQARTTAQELFDARQGQTGDMAKSALDKNISPNGSVATTVDELAALRRQEATPAYEAAGIPRRPESRITAIDEPPTWNTRSVNSPELEALVKDSPDIRRALNTLRRFPDYKNVPADSMAMWDEAYKLLGGMEQSAVRAGENRKAMLIGDLRRDFQTALVDANPDYGRALKAYAGPSKLIDAAEKGKEWFKPGVDPAVVIREFQALPAAEQEAARVGVRDWARSAMDRTDRNASGVALWSSPANRQKLQAILSPKEYTDLSRSMDTVKNAAGTRTDINVGSRTAPMLAEQADNAMADTSMFTDLLSGHPVRAASKFAGKAVERIGEGKTEKVNALVADWLSSTDPEKVGLVNALAERARLQELAKRSGRIEAFRSGGVAIPTTNALLSGNRQ